jgi:hypothetical protein
VCLLIIDANVLVCTYYFVSGLLTLTAVSLCLKA